MTDVTQILAQIGQGDPRAAEQLLPLVYEELRRLAAAKLANEKPGQTLSATHSPRDRQPDSTATFVAGVDAKSRSILDRGSSKAGKIPKKLVRTVALRPAGD